ncbi:MAG TPA: hypothetical protein DDZ51_05275 [Planctomycetaceae bacterium]|nr:hypothetical protein [Planctomycetaceae bacterium]
MSRKSRTLGGPSVVKPTTKSGSEAIDSAIDAIVGGTIAVGKVDKNNAEPLPDIREVQSLKERLIPRKKSSKVIRGICSIVFACVLLLPLLILLQIARSNGGGPEPAAATEDTSQDDPVAPSDASEAETIVENPETQQSTVATNAPSIDKPGPDVEMQQTDTIKELSAKLNEQQKELDKHIDDLRDARKQLEIATSELESKEQQIKTATEQLAKLEPLNIGIKSIQTSISDIQSKLTKPPVSPAQETFKNQTPPSTLTDLLISRLRKQKTSQVNLYWIPAKKGALNLAQVKLIRQIGQQAGDSKIKFHAEVATNDSIKGNFVALDITSLSEDSAYANFPNTQEVSKYVQTVAQKVFPATEVAILVASSEYMIDRRIILPQGLVCIVGTSLESDGKESRLDWKQVCAADDQLYYYSPDKNLYLHTE